MLENMASLDEFGVDETPLPSDHDGNVVMPPPVSIGFRMLIRYSIYLSNFVQTLCYNNFNNVLYYKCPAEFLEKIMGKHMDICRLFANFCEKYTLKCPKPTKLLSTVFRFRLIIEVVYSPLSKKGKTIL